ncbi:PREDICTED: matrix metalloproteinase-25-like [Acromyrmex echinatior]|uniref:matrix metalloproteinase-25-like n=1 Tax=Acromyrmex echinatior TaxID=103372 RepID=UPI000580D091|nr:PREDICTED: matrix metalloproteinase-25-like [Acromyrmex echinatior]
MCKCETVLGTICSDIATTTETTIASLRTEQPSGLDTGGVRLELSKALDLWARNSKLTFQEINSDHADILVYFHRGYHGDGYPFDGRGQILAHAFFPGKDRGGDAHFDEEEIWLLEDESNEEDEILTTKRLAVEKVGNTPEIAQIE